ncbi:hypothetical protein C8R47DRAFT_1084615 [Mycena vitilis]|nr:hypothetical protein C8R47DRAFT_1084615 [Mycena vitilis]
MPGRGPHPRPSTDTGRHPLLLSTREACAHATPAKRNSNYTDEEAAELPTLGYDRTRERGTYALRSQFLRDKRAQRRKMRRLFREKGLNCERRASSRSDFDTAGKAASAPSAAPPGAATPDAATPGRDPTRPHDPTRPSGRTTYAAARPYAAGDQRPQARKINIAASRARDHATRNEKYATRATFDASGRILAPDLGKLVKYGISEFFAFELGGFATVPVKYGAPEDLVTEEPP